MRLLWIYQEQMKSGVDVCPPPDIQPLVYASATLKFPVRKVMNCNGSWNARKKITSSQQQ